MAVQTDLDRLLIVWNLFRGQVNTRIPSAQERIWKAQVAMTPPSSPTPGQNKS